VPSIEDSLRTLRDVQGVFGSFVLSGTGSLVSKDLPAVFDEAVFEEVGPRITRLYETFSTGGEDLDSVMLRYFEHKLYLRKMAWGILGILSGTQINLPALRMAGNLVARRIDPDVAATVSRAPSPPVRPTPSVRSDPGPAGGSSPPATGRSAMAPPGAARTPLVQTTADEFEPAPGSRRQARMYRGRRIDE